MDGVAGDVRSAAGSGGAASSFSSRASVEVAADEVVQPNSLTVPGMGSKAIKPSLSDISVLLSSLEDEDDGCGGGLLKRVPPLMGILSGAFKGRDV